jgi:hypothetical protein
MSRDLDYERVADEPRESPRPRSWFKVIATLAAIAVAWLCLRASWVPFSGNESLSRTKVERIGQFRFPPGATEIATNYVGLQDPTLQVRFKLPSRELDLFVQTASPTPALSSTEIPHEIYSPGPTKPWWQPGRPSVFLAGAWITQPAGARRALHRAVLIDQSSPQQFVVWLVAYRVEVDAETPTTP